GNLTLYEYARSGDYELKRIVEAAETATRGEVENIPVLVQKLNDPNPVVRYWAATGCTVLGAEAQPAKEALIQALDDPQGAVRIAAAEALYLLGEKERVLDVLTKALKSPYEMVRVQALNVLEFMGEDARTSIELVEEMLASGTIDNQEYDKRAARGMLDRLKTKER